MGLSVLVVAFTGILLSMLVSKSYSAPTTNGQNHYIQLYNLKSDMYVRISDSGVDANGQKSDKCANIILEMTAKHDDSTLRIRSGCTTKYVCVHQDGRRLVLEEDLFNSTRCEFTEEHVEGNRLFRSARYGGFIGFDRRGKVRKALIQNRLKQNAWFVVIS